MIVVQDTVAPAGGKIVYRDGDDIICFRHLTGIYVTKTYALAALIHASRV